MSLEVRETLYAVGQSAAVVIIPFFIMYMI
jgi:hypothetical protein